MFKKTIFCIVDFYFISKTMTSITLENEEEPTPQDIQAINESAHWEDGVEGFSFLASLK